MNKKEMLKIIGGMSKTSKLPCSSFNLSAWRCNNGSKLAKIKGSVCDGCYAMTGFYNMFKKKHEENHDRKLNNYYKDTKLWTSTFSSYLNKYEKSGYFRWFDSGDIPSYDFLLNIVNIAKNTPNIKHWLPTKEYKLINKFYKQGNSVPGNLVIRVSAPMIDTEINGYPNTSSVTKNSKTNSIVCNAPQQDNQCKDCRLCWNKDIKNIAYKYH